VISYAVAQRVHEIGIRMALGAQRVSVIWMVLKETLWLLGIGLALGMLLILAQGQVVASLLYEMTPADPLTLTLAMLALSSVAWLAGFLPARRAAQVDPMTALRCD
jgi:ABC-type antimicrobial peptide transport system permease subunit